MEKERIYREYLAMESTIEQIEIESLKGLPEKFIEYVQVLTKQKLQLEDV